MEHIRFLVQQIEVIAEKFGIIFDVETIKARSPKRKGSKRTFDKRKESKLRELCDFVKRNL
jgi:hypothetical protein